MENLSVGLCILGIHVSTLCHRFVNTESTHRHDDYQDSRRTLEHVLLGLGVYYRSVTAQ